MHLNELQEKYGPKGLVVLSVSKEPRSNIDEFVEKTDCKTPIMIEETNSADAYGVTSLPSMYVIGPRGRVLWNGNPGNLRDSEIEGWLEGIRPTPTFPKAMSSVKKAFAKFKYADARKKAQALVDKGGDEDVVSAAKATVEWIDWWGTGGLEDAAKDAEGGNPFAAWVQYDEIATSFKGLEAGDKAKAAIKELLADKDAKNEIKAGKKWLKLEAKVRDLSKKKALRLLEPFVKKYGELRAAARAKALLTKLKRSK